MNKQTSTALAKTERSDVATNAFESMPIDAIVARKKKIHQVMNAVMKDGEHYGKIPGCGDKPTLFKAGAEVLATTFGLAPTFKIEQRDLENDHREYAIVCTLTHIATGAVLGEGVGMCSTMEKKYRYRRDGKENPNIADSFNTVLKMAKKRAQVDCTLTAVGASDLLTQDLEDIRDAEFHETKTERSADVRDTARDAELAAAAREAAHAKTAADPNFGLAADDELEGAAIMLIRKVQATTNGLQLAELNKECNALPKNSRAREVLFDFYQRKAKSFESGGTFGGAA